MEVTEQAFTSETGADDIFILSYNGRQNSEEFRRRRFTLISFLCTN